MKQTISILGCGWLGLPLGEHLVQSGYTVKGSTTRMEKLNNLKKAGIAPYHFSLSPEPDHEVRDFFEGDVLIINIPPRNKNEQAGFHQEQLKSIHSHAGGKINHVLFISSTAVYPAQNQEVVESDAQKSALTRGGISLLEMERIFSESPAYKTTVVRMGGLYGPNRHPGNFLAGKKDLPGADNPVNMIHLEDCMGVIEAIIQQNIWGEIFNAVSPKYESRQSFYEKAALSLGVEAPTFSEEEAPFKKVNVKKLIEMTGYEFRY